MSEIKVNSIKGVSASSAAITVDNSSGSASANLTTVNSVVMPNGGFLSNKNLIQNGAFQIAQRGVSSTSEGFKTVDRFDTEQGGVDEGPTREQADVAAGTTPYTLGFRKCFKITNGNQTGGAGSSDRLLLSTKLEAQDIANSGWNYLSTSSYITLSFWVKSSVAQNFYFRVQATDGTTYSYVMETGSLSADTWTKITKTIPGNSNLTFNNDNGEGLLIRWALFRGTANTGTRPLNAWAAYDGSTRYPDVTSTWYTTNDATFEITGVQLEVGSVATDFEHRSFAQELLLCQRYCQKLGASEGTYDAMGTGAAFSSTVSFIPYSLKVAMRSTPSFTLLGAESDFKYTRSTGEHTPDSITFDQGGNNMCALRLQGSSKTVDAAVRLYNTNTTGGYLFTAEL